MHYRVTTLDNGVTVLSETVSSVRSISLGIWFQTGSRDEARGEEGLSHFNEHMMFKGTPTTSARALSEKFDRLGARQNAFTSKEETCYYADFIDESLPGVFALLADMVKNALFEQDQCELEREVVIEEIARSEDDPEDICYDLFCSSLWPSHTLGLPVAGTRDSVGSFGTSEAKSYHDRYYRAANCFVVAAGNLDHDELVNLARLYLEDLPGSTPNNKELRVPAGRGRAGRFVHAKETEQVHMLLGTAGVTALDEDRYAATIANYVLGGGMASRLFQEVREKLGLVYAVYSLLHPYTDSGLFAIYAGTRPENTEKVIEVVERELARMVKSGVSNEEFELARNAIRGQLALGLESTAQRMRTLGASYMSRGEACSFDETIARYNAVTSAQVQSAIERLMSVDPTIALVGPADAINN